MRVPCSDLQPTAQAICKRSVHKVRGIEGVSCVQWAPRCCAISSPRAGASGARPLRPYLPAAVLRGKTRDQRFSMLRPACPGSDADRHQQRLAGLYPRMWGWRRRWQSRPTRAAEPVSLCLRVPRNEPWFREVHWRHLRVSVRSVEWRDHGRGRFAVCNRYDWSTRCPQRRWEISVFDQFRNRRVYSRLQHRGRRLARQSSGRALRHD